MYHHKFYDVVNLLNFFPHSLQELSPVSYDRESQGILSFDKISVILFSFE